MRRKSIEGMKAERGTIFGMDHPRAQDHRRNVVPVPVVLSPWVRACRHDPCPAAVVIGLHGSVAML